jgi:hypothetical protein
MGSLSSSRAGSRRTCIECRSRAEARSSPRRKYRAPTCEPRGRRRTGPGSLQRVSAALRRDARISFPSSAVCFRTECCGASRGPIDRGGHAERAAAARPQRKGFPPLNSGMIKHRIIHQTTGRRAMRAKPSRFKGTVFLAWRAGDRVCGEHLSSGGRLSNEKLCGN